MTTKITGDVLDLSASIMKSGKGADVASAAALTLGTDGNSFDITGATTITSIGTLGVGTHITLHFGDALTLTHHATDLVLPGATDLTTTAGDIAVFYEYAVGDWRCVSYQVAANAPGGGGLLVARKHVLVTAWSTTSSSMVQITGSELTHTLADAGNKLILKASGGAYVSTSPNQATGYIQVYKNGGGISSEIACCNASTSYGKYGSGNVSIDYAPGDTASHTYSLYGYRYQTGGASTFYVTTELFELLEYTP